MKRPRFLMTDPAFYEVTYSINPWMRPDLWAADVEGSRAAARASWKQLKDTLEGAGAEVVEAPGAPALPDMVFPSQCGGRA